ncbi:MAG: hypothetical protein ACYSVY_17985 [Planctomycetota bacterium]
MARAPFARPLRHPYENNHLITERDRSRVECADDLEIIARRSQVAGPTQARVEQTANHGLAPAFAMRAASIASASDARPFSSVIRRGCAWSRIQAT